MNENPAKNIGIAKSLGGLTQNEKLLIMGISKRTPFPKIIIKKTVISPKKYKKSNDNRVTSLGNLQIWAKTINDKPIKKERTGGKYCAWVAIKGKWKILIISDRAKFER